MNPQTPLMEVNTQNDIGDTSLSKKLSGARSKESNDIRFFTEIHDVQQGSRRSTWLDSWLFEWITLVFGIACFIAIAIILWIYDGKERPKMARGLSLNTIISVLATGCKSSLVLVIGEAISQLKWLWYQDPNQRQLVDMQRFDAASRGPLGSLMIIIHHRARSFVSIGAAVIVLLLAFDPFIQQILSYPVRSTTDTDPMAKALAPQSRYFFTGAGAHGFSGLDRTFTQGFFSFSADGFKVPPQCSSGNCTWSKFPSIDICSRCADMSTTASINCKLPPPTEKFNRTCTLSMSAGSGYTFNVASVPLVENEGGPAIIFPPQIIWQPLDMNNLLFGMRDLSMSTGNEEEHIFNLPNETVAGVKNPLTTLAYAELGLHDGNTSVSDLFYFKNATACSLSICQRDYSIQVDNGSPSIHTQNVDFGSLFLKYPGNVLRSTIIDIRENPLCWMPGPSGAWGFDEARDFAFCESALYALGTIRDYFPSTKETRLGAENDYTNWGVLFTPVYSNDVLMNQLERIGFEDSVENIAAAFTRLGLERTNDTINGTVHVSKVFVSVRWPWMVFPGLLILVGTIFLVSTIVVSKSIPLWKSSALAPYYHGTEGVEDDDSRYLTATVMEKRAEQQVFRFQPSGKNGKLVLQLQESDDASSCAYEAPEPRLPVSAEQHAQGQNL